MNQSASEAPASGVAVQDYRSLFGAQWAPWVGGLLLSAINVMMFAYLKPWNVAEGLENWGNWILRGVGMETGELAPPQLLTTSVTNISLLLGALAAALLSREFGLRLASRRDMARSALGGVFMGVGAVLGMGCTVGAFLSGYSALSLGGVVMLFSLMIGAYLGLRILMWDLQHESPAEHGVAAAPSQRWYRMQPYVGAALLVALLAWMLWDSQQFTYAGITGRRSVLIGFGLLLGIVNQRSRFCFVRAFREPFMTGEAAMTKGAALALVVGVLGFAVIKSGDLSDLRSADTFVNATVWVGGLLGGILFGIGMVLAGGCGTGTLWRAGEGQVKFWLTLLVFCVSGALFSDLMRLYNWREKLGDVAYYVPNLLGWRGGMLFLLALPVAWYLLAAWNERRELFVVR